MVSEPLTPEEEAELRGWAVNHRVRMVPITYVDRLLATLDAERAKIETLRIVGRTVEQALTPTGDHHTLPDGYCLDCSGGCIVPLARENTEALRRAAYAKPDPFGGAK